MASTSRSPRRTGRGRRTTTLRNRTIQSVMDVDDDDVDSVVQIQDDTLNDSCIDLTNETHTDWIDLTRSSNNIMDSPVVVLTPTDAAGLTRRRRGSGRRGSRRSLVPMVRRSTASTTTSRTVHVLTSDDSDSDSLPDAPFQVPEQSRVVNRSLLASPEGIKISCPICMDDAKTITQSHRQVMSTTCGHIFCNVCIQTAINVHKACPTCRKNLTKTKIHPLFI